MFLWILVSDYPWQDGALCSEGERLNSAQFEAAMRNQLHQYSGRRISDFLYHGRGGEAEHAQVKEKGVEEGGFGGRGGGEKKSESLRN